jgi:ketosteroid isomerase-like protein
MTTKLTTMIAMFALCSAATITAEQAKPADAQILTVLRTLVDSQVTFDQKKMETVLAPDYVEISPIGDVDPRAKVLSFYDPAEKGNAPVGKAALEEVSTRTYGDTAVTVSKLTFNLQTPQGVVSRPMRAVFVTRKTAGGWLIVSSQFTPIRTK